MVLGEQGRLPDGYDRLTLARGGQPNADGFDSLGAQTLERCDDAVGGASVFTSEALDELG